VSHFPGKEFTSKIELVYPSLSAETRTAKIRFTIANPDGQLKPQMFTNVEMKINLGKRLAIPKMRSLIQEQGRWSTWTGRWLF